MNTQIPELAAEHSPKFEPSQGTVQGRYTGDSFRQNLRKKVTAAPCCRVWPSISEKPMGVLRLFTLRAQRLVLANERGAVTAEYAIVIMAAVAFAGLLVAIMSSGEVRAMLVGMVQRALGSAG